MANRINWFEIPISDANRAQSFYENIFAIKMHRMEIGNGLTLILFPGEPEEVQGALALHPDFYTPGHQGPLLYLNANPSIDQILQRVVLEGQRVIVPKRQISAERGWMAVFEDPEGNRIGLMADQ